MVQKAKMKKKMQIFWTISDFGVLSGTSKRVKNGPNGQKYPFPPHLHCNHRWISGGAAAPPGWMLGDHSDFATNNAEEK